MVMKIWSIRNPLLGGVLLASAFSQAARAAELPVSQPLPTPGIPTPDQAVRQMATNVVLSSRATAASNIRPTNLGGSRPISPLSIASRLPSPSQVLSNCPANVCGLVATQPPVILGTASPLGIANDTKFVAQNASAPLKAAAPQAITPNDQITSAAKVALSIEPGFSKDVAFGQIVSSPATVKKEVNGTDNQLTATPTIAAITTPEKAIGIGNVRNQITSFTSKLVSSSWKLITVLPKPQLDSSLLNIGSSNSFQQYDSLSFSPRLTLGNAVEPLKKISSLSASPLFTSQEPATKPSSVAIKWGRSSFLVKPLTTDGSRIDKFSSQNSFSSFNFEASTKPFSAVTFLAAVNFPLLSSK